MGRRITLLVLAILIIALGGWYGYKHWFTTPTVAKPIETDAATKQNVIKKKKIDEKDVVPSEQGVALDKTWEYTFSNTLNPSTVTTSTVRVKDKDGNNIDVKPSVSASGTSLYIAPPTQGYKKGTTYTLEMTKGIRYTNGESVSKPYNMTFKTIRDEIETAKLSDKLIYVKKDDISSLSSEEITVNSSVKKDLKAGDILIIPSKENKDGRAIKALSVKEESGSYIIKFGTPYFEELYDSIDMYKTYPIEAKYMTFEPNVKGITIEPIAVSENETMIAATQTGNGTDSEDKPKDEFKTPLLSNASISTKNGFSVELNGAELKHGDNTLILDGSFHSLNPKALLDVKKTDKGEPIDILFAIQSRLENEYGITVKTEKGSKFKRVEDLNKAVDEAFNEKFKLGVFRIPTSVPSVYLSGSINLAFEVSATGEVKAMLSYELTDTKGIARNKEGKYQPYSKPSPKFDGSFKGNGRASFKTGATLEGGVYSFLVLGAGVETFAGVKADVDVAGASNKEEEDYLCWSAKGGPIIETKFYVEAMKMTEIANGPQRLYEYPLSEEDFGIKLPPSFEGNCDAFQRLSSSHKELRLKAGEKVDADILGTYINFLSLKESEKVLDNFSKAKVYFSKDGVATAKKLNKHVFVTASKQPTSATANLIIEYGEKSSALGKTKNSKLVIPVKITDYDEVQEALKIKKEKQRKKDEAKKKSQQALGGTWSRNMQGYTGSLKISNTTADTFDFALDVASGGHVGEIDGTADISGDTATFKESEFNSGCVLTFQLNGDSIDIDEGNGCEEFHGMATSFEGTYDKGEANMPEQSLSALNIVTPDEDSDIKALLGSDYPIMVENMIHAREGEDLDGFGGKVIFGGAPGLYTIQEGAIIIDAHGALCVAVLVNQGEELHFYTQNEMFKDTLPQTIEAWRVNFADKPVKFYYKPLD